MSYKLSDVVIEDGEYWVLRVPFGFKVYETGVTHSTLRATIGHTGETGLNKARAEIARRQTINNAK